MAHADPGAPRAQRVLATVAFTLIALSALDVIGLLVLRAVGVADSAFQTGGLLVLQLLPLPGLTLGLLCVVGLLILLAIRRARDQGSQRDRR